MVTPGFGIRGSSLPDQFQKDLPGLLFSLGKIRKFGEGSLTILPEEFDGVELRRIRGQKKQVDVKLSGLLLD